MNDFFPFEEVYDFSDISSFCEADDAPHRDAARALACCVNDTGRVDLHRMTETSGLLIWELVNALKGIIFQDPEEYDRNHSDEDGWLLRAQYMAW